MTLEIAGCLALGPAIKGVKSWGTGASKCPALVDNLYWRGGPIRESDLTTGPYGTFDVGCPLIPRAIGLSHIVG